MITDEIINALDRGSGLNAQDFDFQDLDFNIPMDDFESMRINGPANNNGMGINNNSGFNNQVFMNNQTLMNSNMVANNNWAMTPTLAAAPQVVNNNNNYAAMAGYMPMDTDLPMSNPMAAPLDMPTANTTMATGQFCKYICLDPGDAAVLNRKIGRGHSQQTWSSTTTWPSTTSFGCHGLRGNC
ncbi:hypothetical protein HDV57DRAFT_56148 [Trichoderma longibrachiatum]